MATKSPDKSPKAPDYKNEKVHVVVHRKPHCIVEYEVEAFRPICFEAHKKAAKSVGKEISVPGFRKGKAPIEIIQKRHPQELDKRWQEAIANAAYRESAQLANVPVINQEATISFKMESHSTDHAKLTLSFETIPDIPSVDPAKCVLKPVKRPEVSKEKVEETIRQTQMFFSKWEAVENRTIKKNDFLLLDLDVIEEDPPQTLFSNTRFEVADKSMAQWMQKLVIGKKAGDIVEGVSKPDDSLSEEEKKEYPPKKVRITIKAIEEAKLPELNDEFAKQVGAEDVATLRKNVENLLNKKADEHIREEKREKVTEFLLSHHVDLPHSVIEKETQFRLEQMIQDPQFKKQWDASSDEEKRGLVDNAKAQAEKAVRIFYICRKIAADQNISISPQDLPNAAADPLEALLYPSAQPHDPRQPDIKQAEAYSRVLLEKTEDWVIAHARTASTASKKKEPTGTKEVKPKKKAAPTKKTAAKKTAAKPRKKAAPKPKQEKA